MIDFLPFLATSLHLSQNPVHPSPPQVQQAEVAARESHEAERKGLELKLEGLKRELATQAQAAKAELARHMEVAATQQQQADERVLESAAREEVCEPAQDGVRFCLPRAPCGTLALSRVLEHAYLF